MKEPLIVVQGSLNYDFIVKSNRLPAKGETLIGNMNSVAGGGKGANQAAQIAKLGADTYLIGRLGRDQMGEFLLEQQHQAGTKTEFISYDDSGTGIGCVQCDDIGNYYAVVIPNANGKCSSKDVIEAAEVIAKADFCVCQLETTEDAALAFVDTAYANGVPVVLNPAPAMEIDKKVFRKLYAITPNETEAAYYTRIPADEISTKQGRKAAADILINMGVERVIITLGAEGCYYKDKLRSLSVPAFKITAVDTTAAGDAFTGALCYTLAKKMPIEEALRFASAAGALAASKLGAQMSLCDFTGISGFLSERSV